MAKLDIEIVTSLDYSNLEQRLNDAGFRVFTRWESRAVDFVVDRWVGWQYRGRPAGAPRLVSHDAWKGSVQTTTEGAELSVINDARDYRSGRPYVRHVHRAGERGEEWRKVADQFVAELLPEMVAELTKALTEEMTAGKAPRRGPASGTDILKLDI